MRGDAAGLARWGARLSALAGIVHMLAMPEHLREWWGYGAFFLVAAGAQLYYAMAMLCIAHDARSLGAGARHPAPGWTWSTRSLIGAGIAGNAAIIALYVVTRTVGIPALGPAAGQVEPVTPLSVVSKGAELALVGVLAAMLASRAAGRAGAGEPGAA